MGFFDSILPQGDPNAQTPNNLMAMIAQNGLPITAGQASAASQMTPGVTTTPGTPPPDPMAGLRDAFAKTQAANVPNVAPAPAGGSPSPTPTTPLQAGLAAGSDAAANTRAESNPLNTLLISLAHGVTAGVPAFRAQRQANQEAAAAAALQASQEKQYRDMLDSPALARQFGDKVAILKGMPSAEGQKILGDAGLWKPATFTTSANGDTTNIATGAVVRHGSAGNVPEGEARPIFDAAGNVTGYQIPNPKPVPTTIDRMSPGMIDAGVGLGYNNDARQWTPAQRAAAYALDPENPINKQRSARAGAASAPDVVGAEVNKKILGDISTATPAMRQANTDMQTFQHGIDLLNSGQVNTGIGANVLQGWSRMTNPQKAAATQEYINTIGPTVLGGVKGQLGAGASMRITQGEVQAFGKMFGGDITQLPAALTATLQARLATARQNITGHNARVTAFAQSNPKFANAILQQYSVPMTAPGHQEGDEWTGNDGRTHAIYHGQEVVDPGKP